MPERYGPWKTAHERLRRCTADGTWDRVLEHVVVKAYSHPSTRRALRARRIAFTCPERSDQVAYRKARGPAGGRPPSFDAVIYRDRNVVERCFARLKQFLALATRYAKRVACYRSQLVIATIALWLRDLQDRA